ncbi:ribosomal protein L11, RNA binding domain-containing protein [Pelagophyceae sp. CCMP2097]|nr:ribosomal protein L11, RNA binding domain-containing protein [Pelagophyceae sp. CCMP2097]
MAGVKAVVRLKCPAGVAKPGPAIGQALGPHGLNMMEFVKAFNAATQKTFPPETPIPVVLTAYNNRTFTFITKSPPASYLILQQLGIEKGATKPGSQIVGKITWSQIRKVVNSKKNDAHLSHIAFDALCRSVAGSASSMGIEVQAVDPGAAEDEAQDAITAAEPKMVAKAPKEKASGKKKGK